ncbi:MAG: TlpA family protein disulfide reductase [Verrucomicrobiales bacterium]|nr:TlpA family protein disulfide reductase [Verrucomicrobiales bacterium]
MDETKKLPDVIEKAYEKTDKRDVQTVLQQMVMPMMRACSENGEKDRAKKFLAKAKEDILGQPEIQQNPQAVAQINGIFGQMEGQLNQPGPGDEMKIAFTSTAEKEFDLADLKGKVVLVDFWATWCGPCIQEMPNVINAYQEYHDKGFEVVGISLDQDRAKLDAFVDQNKMPWPQYFDGKGWQNEIAGQFGIDSIPATFLIGKDGKIAATNLRGPDLERAIKEELAKGDGAE